MAGKEKLGSEIKLYLYPHYKDYFERTKLKFGELTDAIVPLIAGGIPSLEEFKTFLGKCFEELKPQLSIAESFANVMKITIKEKCTVTNIACLETIVDHYNIENARRRITTYKSSVDKICVEFKESVLELTTVSTPFKYESIMFVLVWQRTDDLTLNDIDGLLWKAFGDMANKVSFHYGLKRDTASIEWRHDDNSVLVISPSTEQCEKIVSRLKREKKIRETSLWRIELRSSTAESALVLIDNLDQFAVRELSIEDTSLDERCISKLSKKFTKMKKLLLNSSSLPTGSIKEVIFALAPINTSLEGLFLWNVPITDDDVICLSKVISNNRTLKILDLSNCDITDKGVQSLCEGVAKNQTLTMLAVSNNLQITSASTSAIVKLIKTTKSLETLYLRNTSLNDDDIKTISNALTESTIIQQLVLSEQHEKICKTVSPSIKDKLYFVMEKPSGADLVTGSPSDHHHLHSTKQEKDRYIALLTRKLEVVTREKEEITTTLQTKLQEYKQQLLKTTDISSYLPTLVVILQPVQEDWEQLGLQLNIDQSVLTDIRNKTDSTEQIKCLLGEWALKGGTLIQLEKALLYLGKKEVIPDLHALQEKESIVIDTSEQISTKSNDKSDYGSMDRKQQQDLSSKLTTEKRGILLMIAFSIIPLLAIAIVWFKDVHLKEGMWMIIPFLIILLLCIVVASFKDAHVKEDISYIKKNVIGGTADIIQWMDDSFKMDILPGSFTKGHKVDILVSTSHSHQFVIPKGYKLFSQTYEIIVTEKLQQPLTLTLKHNAVISTEEEAKSLVILHQNNEGETEILQGHTELNSSFITFQLTELSGVAVAGPDGINPKYFLSFYRQKISNYHDSNPQLQILALISRSEQNHKNKRDELLKHEWIADNNPIPYNVEVNGTKLSLEVKPEGCWNITNKRELIVKMTSEDDSNIGSVVMQYNLSKRLVHQSKITFCNTKDEGDYETFVNHQIIQPKLQDIIWRKVKDNYKLIMIFTVISIIGLVVLSLCCNFGPLKGHCIEIFIIIVLMIILFLFWFLEAIGVLKAVLVFVFIVLTLVLLKKFEYLEVLNSIGQVGTFLKGLLSGNG